MIVQPGKQTELALRWKKSIQNTQCASWLADLLMLGGKTKDGRDLMALKEANIGHVCRLVTKPVDLS